MLVCIDYVWINARTVSMNASMCRLCMNSCTYGVDECGLCRLCMCKCTYSINLDVFECDWLSTMQLIDERMRVDSVECERMRTECNGMRGTTIVEARRCVFDCVYIWLCVWACIYTYVFVCDLICVCMYIYVYRSITLLTDRSIHQSIEYVTIKPRCVSMNARMCRLCMN